MYFTILYTLMYLLKNNFYVFTIQMSLNNVCFMTLRYLYYVSLNVEDT